MLETIRVLHFHKKVSASALKEPSNENGQQLIRKRDTTTVSAPAQGPQRRLPSSANETLGKRNGAAIEKNTMANDAG